MKRLSYWRDENGASSAEFALVLIPFMAAVFAIIYASLMFYANQTLQFAAETAARCYSVNAATCNTITNVQTYARNNYKGPNIGASFTATATGCGHTVTGTGSFPINVVVYRASVPLSATACFP